MHQTFYRKYRPRTLDEVCGQEVIVTILKNQFKKDTASHAYLFSGPRGTGKTTVAKIFARSLNCSGTNKPCEKCDFCKQKQEDVLDVIEIDAASNNGVDEIRELKSKINLTPTHGKYKIYIIDEVHMLTPSAFNALLKTLEEPPRYAAFVLATTEPHKVPETILSRCQRLDFKRLTEKAIVERLKYIKNLEKINVEQEALEEIARVSLGGMRDAISLLEQTYAYNPTLITIDDVHKVNGTLTQKELAKLIDDMLNGNMEQILLKTEQYYNDGKNMVKVMEEIINYFRLKLIKLRKNEIEEDKWRQFDFAELLAKLIKLNKFLYDMRLDPSPKTLLEIGLIDFSENQNLKQTDVEKEEPSEKKKKTKEKTVEKIDVEKIKRRRIDNTFAKVSKQFKNEIEKLISDRSLEITKGGELGYLLLDGEVVAASDEHQYFIIKFNSATCSELYNQNLNKFEQILEKELKMKLKSIAVCEEEWFEYRTEFKKNKGKYVFIKENGEEEAFLQEKKEGFNEIETEFAGLIESK